MTSRQNRKARRAAERAARKTAPDKAMDGNPAAQPTSLELESSLQEPRKPEVSASESQPEPRPPQNAQSEPGPSLPPTLSSRPATPVSASRLTANRANAQLSTGPTSATGKATSSRNALKTALTGRTVLLPEDDAERYEKHLREYNRIYKPVGERECELVQSLADATWRLDRIPGLEEALYVKGCNAFAAEVSELEPRARLSMLRMHTYVAYERQFRNLQIQEVRLHRLREKLVAEVKQLQQERDQKEQDDLAMAAKLYIAAKHDRKPFDPAEFGFDFSTADVEGFLHGQRASFLTEKAMSARRD